MMRVETESYRGYQIDVVHNPPMWNANIYPESPKTPPINSALPPIRCKTKEEAFAEARKRVDEHA